jgi:Fe2+ transport system protein FeoA
MARKRALGELEIGESARISSIDLPADYEQRLAELGVMPGVEVSIVQEAPLGDPIAIECNGRRMGLRRADALKISVE